MKKLSICLLAFLVTTICCQPLTAQNDGLTQAFKEQTIKGVNDLMIDHYVFPEVAKKTAAYLSEQLKSGQYDDISDVGSFGDALTKAVQSVNHDKHMRIRPMPVRKEVENTPERMIEEQMANLIQHRNRMAGFKEAKKLDGNIGYLDLRGFASVDAGAPVADLYMGLLETSDAVIIDLRKNGGGSPEMVQYLCSYFFDKHVHLNSLYWRQGEQTQEFWTLGEVGGKKMSDVPLFVLTSARTFSAAEEFSYNMQTQKRATLVGETTGGGANPGGGFPINKKLMVFIPTGKAINPVTKTNWEGVGVVPEVKTLAEDAFDKAVELATIAAENYRHQLEKKYKELFANLNSNIDAYRGSSSEKSVVESMKACKEAGLIGEGEINGLGYQYLIEHEKPLTAELIFKTNTLLYPNSANVYDSYGEALAANGKLNQALKSYEMAVQVAEKNGAPNLDLFKENLEKIKKKATGKP